MSLKFRALFWKMFTAVLKREVLALFLRVLGETMKDKLVRVAIVGVLAALGYFQEKDAEVKNPLAQAESAARIREMVESAVKRPPVEPVVMKKPAD